MVENLELWQGPAAGRVAGYANKSSFKWAADRYPIPDQGYRVNGKPAWTRENLVAWRAGVPKPGVRKVL